MSVSLVWERAGHPREPRSQRVLLVYDSLRRFSKFENTIENLKQDKNRVKNKITSKVQSNLFEKIRLLESVGLWKSSRSLVLVAPLEHLPSRGDRLSQCTDGRSTRTNNNGRRRIPRLTYLLLTTSKSKWVGDPNYNGRSTQTNYSCSIRTNNNGRSTRMDKDGRSTQTNNRDVAHGQRKMAEGSSWTKYTDSERHWRSKRTEDPHGPSTQKNLARRQKKLGSSDWYRETQLKDRQGRSKHLEIQSKRMHTDTLRKS